MTTHLVNLIDKDVNLNPYINLILMVQEEGPYHGDHAFTGLMASVISDLFLVVKSKDTFIGFATSHFTYFTLLLILGAHYVFQCLRLR